MNNFKKILIWFGVIWAIGCFLMYPMVDPFVAGGGPDDAVKGMDTVLFIVVISGCSIILIGCLIFGIHEAINKKSGKCE